jgi:hypothetical protein
VADPGFQETDNFSLNIAFAKLLFQDVQSLSPQSSEYDIPGQMSTV